MGRPFPASPGPRGAPATWSRSAWRTFASRSRAPPTRRTQARGSPVASVWDRVAGRTRSALVAGLRSLKPPLAPGYYEELEEVLVSADIGPAMAARLVSAVQKQALRTREEAAGALVNVAMTVMSKKSRELIPPLPAGERVGESAGWRAVRIAARARRGARPQQPGAGPRVQPRHPDHRSRADQAGQQRARRSRHCDRVRAGHPGQAGWSGGGHRRPGPVRPRSLHSVTFRKLMRLPDPHCHTVASDGMGTPAELVEAAVKANGDLIAVTDHDTMACVKEVQQRGEGAGLIVVAGEGITTK